MLKSAFFFNFWPFFDDVIKYIFWKFFFAHRDSIIIHSNCAKFHSITISRSKVMANWIFGQFSSFYGWNGHFWTLKANNFRLDGPNDLKFWQRAQNSQFYDLFAGFYKKIKIRRKIADISIFSKKWRHDDVIEKWRHNLSFFFD